MADDIVARARAALAGITAGVDWGKGAVDWDSWIAAAERQAANDADFLKQSPGLVAELVAEVERLRRGPTASRRQAHFCGLSFRLVRSGRGVSCWPSRQRTRLRMLLVGRVVTWIRSTFTRSSPRSLRRGGGSE